MCSTTDDSRPLVELNPVPDTFVSDLGRVDILTDNVRFVCWTEYFPEEGAAPQRMICAKIVVPRAVILSAINRALFALGYPVVVGEHGTELVQ